MKNVNRVLFNKMDRKEYNRQYYIKNHDKLLNKSKNNYHNNEEYYKTYRKNKYKTDFYTNIKQKIYTYKITDIITKRFYNPSDYIDNEWVLYELEKCNNKCNLCGNNLLLISDYPFNQCQLSIDRINNKLPHIRTNCRITCLHCNLCGKKK